MQLKNYILETIRRQALRRHWQSITQTAYEMEHLEENKAFEVVVILQLGIDKTLSLNEKF